MAVVLDMIEYYSGFIISETFLILYINVCPHTYKTSEIFV